MAEYFLFFFGIGFFLLVFIMIQRDEEKRYQRKIDEAREFGYEKTKKRERRWLRKDLE